MSDVAQTDRQNVTSTDKPVTQVIAVGATVVPFDSAKAKTTGDNLNGAPRFESALPAYYDRDATNKVGFQPVLMSRHVDNGSSTLSHMGLNFNLSTFFSYYPMLRWAGYMGEATTSRASKLMERHFKERAAGELQIANPKNMYEKYLNKFSKNKDFYSGGPDFVTPLAQAEAVGFTALATVFSSKEYKDLKNNCALAVAAERGKDESEIGFMDLRSSNNPVVASAVDRFIWQTASRHGAGMSFFGGLLPGIIGNTALFTLERTVFYRPISYDILSKTVNDVQINRLGDESKPNLIDGLIRAMQAARLDHRQPLIPKEQIDGLRPVLNKIAEDVIDRNFGLRGVVYLMGGGILVPENPELSMRNYEHVHELGVSGVAQEGKWIREQTGARANQTWQMTLRMQRDKDYVAESAKENALLDQRDAIYQRGPLHAGVYRDGMRGGDRSGAGVGM